jgi:CheY-like chemotaxis protein
MYQPLALLAEEDPAVRLVLAALLCQAGFATWTVSCAAAIADALETLKERPNRIVVMAAEASSWAATDWLAEMSRRAEWRDVPVILTTGLPTSVFCEALRRSGTPVLVKPIRRARLRQAVRQLGFAFVRPPRELARAASLVLKIAARCAESKRLGRKLLQTIQAGARSSSTASDPKQWSYVTPRGRRILKVVPAASDDSTSIVPSWARTISRTM